MQFLGGHEPTVVQASRKSMAPEAQAAQPRPRSRSIDLRRTSRLPQAVPVIRKVVNGGSSSPVTGSKQRSAPWVAVRLANWAVPYQGGHGWAVTTSKKVQLSRSTMGAVDAEGGVTFWPRASPHGARDIGRARRSVGGRRLRLISCAQLGQRVMPFLDTLHTVTDIAQHRPGERRRQPLRDRQRSRTRSESS